LRLSDTWCEQFIRHQSIHADFSGGQITSDAGLLPLRAFDQRHHLTRDWTTLLRDPRQDDRVRHDSLALLRQRLYQLRRHPNAVSQSVLLGSAKFGLQCAQNWSAAHWAQPKRRVGLCHVLAVGTVEKAELLLTVGGIVGGIEHTQWQPAGHF
jgi:hypothetical protein